MVHRLQRCVGGIKWSRTCVVSESGPLSRNSSGACQAALETLDDAFTSWSHLSSNVAATCRRLCHEMS